MQYLMLMVLLPSWNTWVIFSSSTAAVIKKTGRTDCWVWASLQNLLHVWGFSGSFYHYLKHFFVQLLQFSNERRLSSEKSQFSLLFGTVGILKLTGVNLVSMLCGCWHLPCIGKKTRGTTVYPLPPPPKKKKQLCNVPTVHMHCQQWHCTAVFWGVMGVPYYLLFLF